jgi:hypothetical protein
VPDPRVDFFGGDDGGAMTPQPRERRVEVRLLLLKELAKRPFARNLTQLRISPSRSQV